MSIFQHRRFRRFRSAMFETPRRPRHPLLRIALGVLGIALLLGLVAVSYTHLDVYKRQAMGDAGDVGFRT